MLSSCFFYKMHKASCSPGLHILFVLLYSQSSWWHVVKEWGVRELREALWQLSPVKEKTSRVWVQGLTSVGILACVQIVRWVQKERVISRFSLCCLGACQCALVNEFKRVWPPNSTFEVTSCRFIYICINRLLSWLKLNALVGIISQKFKALWQPMSLVYFSFFPTGVQFVSIVEQPHWSACSFAVSCLSGFSLRLNWTI